MRGRLAVMALLFMGVLVALWLSVGGALAQDGASAPLKIGIVDINGVLGQSVAMTKIRATIDEENKKFQATIEAEQRELRSAEANLNAERQLLDASEFNTRVQEFERRVIILQQRTQAQRQNFDATLKRADEHLRALLLQIIGEIAAEESFDLVMQRQNVVLFQSEFNISAEALRRLNERTKDLTITLPNKETQ